MKKLLLIVVSVVAVGLLVGGVLWWFVVRDDAPAAVSLPDQPAGTTAVSTVPASADGDWIVQPGPQVFLGYRVDEVYAAGAVKNTAVGRTPGILGTMTIAGTAITKAEIAADMSQLRSDQARRDARMKTDGLQTDAFPTAVFKLAQPLALPSAPAVGEVVKLQAVGDLTLHGVTRSIGVQLDARWNGDTIDVAGGTPITLADFGITPPSVGGFVMSADTGILELQLTFIRRT